MRSKNVAEIALEGTGAPPLERARRRRIAIAEFTTFKTQFYFIGLGTPRPKRSMEGGVAPLEEGHGVYFAKAMGPLWPRIFFQLRYYREMADSRNKGAAFERDIVKRLNGFFEEQGVATRCKRNLDQYQAKNLCDITIPGYAIECKAYKEGWWFQKAWWEQVCSAAGDDIPVLVWKFNNKPIRVTLPMGAFNPNYADLEGCAVIPFDDWLDILAKDWIPEQKAA